MKRLNVYLSDQEFQLVREIAESSGRKMTRVAVDAIASHRFLLTATQKGDRILRERAGKLVELILL